MSWMPKCLLPALALAMAGLLSCRKETWTGSPAQALYTTADTVRFDTVFATTPSPVQAVKIFNPNREGVHIRRIALAGGAASPFRLLADGRSGPEIPDTELAGGDSTWLYLQVRPPGGTNPLPFELADSVLVEWDNGRLVLPLRARGQAARILKGHRVSGREVLDARLPILVLDSLVVPSGAELVLSRGCRLFVHGVTPIRVEGLLNAAGGPDSADRIVITGDRLDAPYRDFPGSWNGITVTGSGRVQLLHTDLLKARTALDLLEGSTAVLQHVVLAEASVAGLRSKRGQVEAGNLLIANCAAGLLLNGGSYTMEHITVAAGPHRYVARKEPLMQASAAAGPLQGLFRNCIFWAPEGGSPTSDEVRFEPGGNYSLLFEGVAWRTGTLPAGVQARATVLNGVEPGFEDAGGNPPSFRLREGAPAVDAGSPSGLRSDLEGKPRPVRAPDLGAYERQ